MIGVINDVLGSLSDTAAIAVKKITVAAKETKKTLNTTAGKAATKAVILFSVMTAVAQGLRAVVMPIPQVFSFSDIYLTIMRILGLLGEFLGLKKKVKKWGIVYDSETKRPLDPVYVSIFDDQGKQIEQRFTDMEGRFGFLVTPGKYRVEANKTHYIFPSVKVTGKKDELYDNLYYGEMLEIKDETVINVNIPMDPLDIDWNEEIKKKMFKFNPKKEILKKRISSAVFYAGLIISPITYWATPNTLNLVIMLAYLGILILRQTGFKQKNYGRIYDKETKKPIPFAKVVISYPNLPDQRVAFGVSDITGRYYILVVDEGEYLIHIQGKTIEGKEVDEKFSFNAKERLINSDFWI